MNLWDLGTSKEACIHTRQARISILCRKCETTVSSDDRNSGTDIGGTKQRDYAQR